MRAATGPIYFFENERFEPMPEIGDHALLMDSSECPRLIWRTTNWSVAPLSSVGEEFVWRDGIGDGDRLEWLRLHQAEYARQGRIYGFEMHSNIETVFVSFEVVWPDEVARRIRLIAPQLERGIAMLCHLNEQRSISEGLEAILSRIETAVLTTTPDLKLGYCNPTGEALLRRSDGLLVRHGRLEARDHQDTRGLLAAVAGMPLSGGHTGRGALVAIRRSGHRPPYRASLFPVRAGHPIHDLTARSDLLWFVDDPDHDLSPTRAQFYSRAFGLTPAEARLAIHLATGASLTEAADAFGVTHNTVRAQLRAIFDKTDTRRQTDLVRLLQGASSLRISFS